MSRRILVAPTAFKASMGPREVADALARGALEASPDAKVITCPVSDGGDGLLEAVLPAEARQEPIEVTGPVGQPVQAILGWLDPRTALFESASACGLRLVPPSALDPLGATSRGVGEMIAAASQRGADSIIVGLGGSATTDGGTGAARGLGWTFTDANGNALPEGGGALVHLADFSGGWGREARLIALSDVTTPLTGPAGAARVFAPQKGATAEQVELLARGLERLGAVLARHGRPDLALAPMGGAAGGLGAGLAYFARARLVNGAEWVLKRVGFDAALAGADLVLTGEGRFDATSMAGKVVGAVVRRAQTARRKVVVVAAEARDAMGIHVVDGGGQRLDGDDLAALAKRATSEAFGLPAS